MVAVYMERRHNDSSVVRRGGIMVEVYYIGEDNGSGLY